MWGNGITLKYFIFTKWETHFCGLRIVIIDALTSTILSLWGLPKTDQFQELTTSLKSAKNKNTKNKSVEKFVHVFVVFYIFSNRKTKNWVKRGLVTKKAVAMRTWTRQINLNNKKDIEKKCASSETNERHANKVNFSRLLYILSFFRGRQQQHTCTC